MKPAIQPVRVLLKALGFFVMINILYAWIVPPDFALSGYNTIFPGRTRLPFGTRNDPFSLTVDDVDAMFPSHLIAAPKAANEYRVVLIGDSSVWGEDLGSHEIISEQWNQMNTRCGEKTIRAYDLGYPHPSVVKDLVILDKALEYEPDFIVWFVTLNSLVTDKVNPFLIANREQAADILGRYDIGFKRDGQLLENGNDFWNRTLIGQRSNLARQIKLQLLGIIWTATGADTNRLAVEDAPNFNIGDDPRYHGMDSSGDIRELLLFDALSAGNDMSSPIPVLIVNEPIFIAKEEYATVRYNALFPRWAYDQYRAAITAQAQSSGWHFLDVWDAIPREYFNDAGLHLSAEGERQLVQKVVPALQSVGCESNQ